MTVCGDLNARKITRKNNGATIMMPSLQHVPRLPTRKRIILLFIFATTCIRWQCYRVNDVSSSTRRSGALSSASDVELPPAPPAPLTKILLEKDERELNVRIAPISSTPSVEMQKQKATHDALPTKLSFTYNKDLASQAIKPATWMCGDRGNPPAKNRPFISFVHVYKTAGSTLRTFFIDYAKLCKKSVMIIVNCSGVKHSILASKKNLGENNSHNWNSCRLKATVDARNHIAEQEGMKNRVYPTVNNTILQSNFDILAGHYRMGVTDYVFQEGNNPSVNNHVASEASPPLMASITTPVRHIIFLRQPMERYVSSILYRAKQFAMNQKETVEDTANYIKKRIRTARKKQEYLDSIFKYLLSPEQAQTMGKQNIEGIENLIEYKTQLAIQNLVRYNVIMGMTERFSESMTILQHVLLPGNYSSTEREEWVHEMMDGYTASPSAKDGKINQRSEKGGKVTEAKQENTSQMGSISTSSVMAALKKDDDFMEEFREYLKYEQRIVDFALEMHHLQYDLVIESNLQKAK